MNKIMYKSIAAGLIIFTIISTAGCAGSLKSQYRKGATHAFYGVIDNLIMVDTSYDKEELTLTSVGFSTGQGLSLIGMHPGLTKGKNIRITAEYYGASKGTDLFKLLKIEQVGEAVPTGKEEAATSTGTIE